MRNSPITHSDIVFLGDSLTEGFDLHRYFREPGVKNRGLSGDMTYEVLYRMDEILKAQPRKLFLMIGINDLLNGEDEVVVFGNIVEILDHFREQSPETRLYLQSILPVKASAIFLDEDFNLVIFSLNDSLERYCKNHGIDFIDLNPHFLDDMGEMDKKYTYDGVHLTPEGYELWAILIQTAVQQV